MVSFVQRYSDIGSDDGLMLRLAVILCNDTVRTMLLNNARGILYSVSPSFPMLAGIRAAYMLLVTGKTQPVSLLLYQVNKIQKC